MTSSRFRRAVGLSRRQSVEREVDDELAFHLDMRTRQLMATGWSAEAARAEAIRAFGNVADTRATCVTHDQERLRAMRRSTLFDELGQDLAWAGRVLRRHAGFALMVAGTIALGIGTNSAIFSLVHAVLLRTLPVPAAHELVALGDPGMVGAVLHNTGPNTDMFSWGAYLHLRDRHDLFRGLAASGRADRIEVRTSRSQAEPGRPRTRFVSGNYFEVLGVRAAQGSLLTASADAAIGAAPLAAVSHAYWTGTLGGDPRVVGRELLVNDVRVTIIGVADPSFSGDIVGQVVELWLPATLQPVVMPRRPWLTERDAYWLQVVGRPAGGVTRAQLSPRVTTALRAYFSSAGIGTAQELAELTVPVHDGARGHSRLRSMFGPALLTLLIGSTLLLLMICANVANLLMARALGRTREVSVRLAIGAGRGRLVRQLLVESLTLGLLGAAGGLWVSQVGSRALLALATDGFPGVRLDASIGAAVVGFTLGAALLATLTFGLAPALRATRVDLASALRASARSMSGTLGHARKHLGGRALIATQVALSMVLLTGAALLVRSLSHLRQVDTGLDRDHLVIVDVDAQSAGYAGRGLLALATDVVERFGRLPGVTAVTWSENGIFSGTESGASFQVPGFTATQVDDTSAAYDLVGPGYVRAIGARLLRGRDMEARDMTGAPVALVNQTFANFYFGDADPLGRTIRFNDTSAVQIVGVVADVRDHSLSEAVRRRFYLPGHLSPQGEPGALSFEVRAHGDPALLVEPLRRTMQAVDPRITIELLAPLTQLMEQSVNEERLLARLATAFGVLALLLASLGLYGVMSYAVARRTGELGLRTALGATAGVVQRGVVGEALRIVGLGLGIGVPLGIGTLRLLASQVHGVGAADPWSLGVAVAALTASAALAAWIPARRASRVSPLVALQRE